MRDLMQLPTESIPLGNPPSAIVIHRIGTPEAFEKLRLFVFERFITLIQLHLRGAMDP